MSTVSVRPVLDGNDLREFLALVPALMSRDPYHSPTEVRERMLLEYSAHHLEIEHFLASSNGRITGRISAFIDPRQSEDGAGFFANFLTIDDRECAWTLLRVASDWVERRGCNRLVGPAPILPFDGSGLAESRDRVAGEGMPQNPGYCIDMMQACGWTQERAMQSWLIPTGALPRQARAIAEAACQYPKLSIRALRDDEDDLHAAHGIFQNSYATTVGALRPDFAEFCHALTCYALDHEVCRIAFMEDQPAALALVATNQPPIQKGPLLTRIFQRWKTVRNVSRTYRVLAFGVCPAYRGSAVGALGLALYAEMVDAAQRVGYAGGETLVHAEDERTNHALGIVGAQLSTRYPVFGADIPIQRPDWW